MKVTVDEQALWTESSALTINRAVIAVLHRGAGGCHRDDFFIPYVTGDSCERYLACCSAAVVRVNDNGWHRNQSL